MDDLSNSIMNIDIKIESSRQNIEDSFNSQSQSIKLNFDTISHNKREVNRINQTNPNKLELNLESIIYGVNSNHTDNDSVINNDPLDTPDNIFIRNTHNLSADNIELDINRINLNNSAHTSSIIDHTVNIAVPKTGRIEDNSSFSCKDKSAVQEDHTKRLKKSINDSSLYTLNEIRIKKTLEFGHGDGVLIDYQKNEGHIRYLAREVSQKKETAEEAPEYNIKTQNHKSTAIIIDQIIKTSEKKRSPNVFNLIKQEKCLMLEKQLSTNNFILKLMRKSKYSHLNTNTNTYYISYHNDSLFDSNLVIPLTSSNNNQLIELEKNLKFSLKSIFDFLSNFLNFAKSFRNVLNTSLDHANNFNLFLIYMIKDKLSTFSLSKVKDFNFLELKLRDTLKVIKIEDAICGIKSYVEFLLKNLFDSVDKKFVENLNEEFKNLSKTNLEKIKHTMLYDQIITIKEKFLKFFTLNKKKSDFEDKDSTKKYFCYLLMNVKNYFFEFFPSCCGSEKIFKNGKKNNSKKLLLCFKCKILICSNCTKYHKGHKYFDLKNFDYKNIEEDIVLGTILENFSFNNSNSILDLIEILLYENFLKTFLTQNFKETKKKFLNETFLIRSIFSELSKPKYFSFSNEYNDSDKENNINNSFITIVEEYKKLISIEQSIKKQNHNLIEEFFINNLSLELNLNKFILNSNPDLNYDVTSTSNDFSLIISQCNSVKEFYRENLKSNKKENSKCVKKFTPCEKFQNENGWKKFSTDFKFVSDSPQEIDCEELQKKIQEKILGLKNNLPSNENKTGLLQKIIEKLIREEKFLKLFTKINLFEENDIDELEYRFRDEFVPKLEVVIFFLDDWINKVSSIGEPVFE